MKNFVTTTLILTLFSFVPLSAASVYDDHGCCCWRSEKNSRWVWLGGAALLGAGAGALTGYYAGRNDHSSSHHGHSSKDDEKETVLEKVSTQGYKSNAKYVTDTTSELTIAGHGLALPEGHSSVLSFEVLDPMGLPLWAEKGATNLADNQLFVHLWESIPKMIGVYTLRITIEEIFLPAGAASQGLYREIHLSNGKEITLMDLVSSPTELAPGVVLEYKGNFLPKKETK